MRRFLRHLATDLAAALGGLLRVRWPLLALVTLLLIVDLALRMRPFGSSIAALGGLLAGSLLSALLARRTAGPGALIAPTFAGLASAGAVGVIAALGALPGLVVAIATVIITGRAAEMAAHEGGGFSVLEPAFLPGLAIAALGVLYLLGRLGAATPAAAAGAKLAAALGGSWRIVRGRLVAAQLAYRGCGLALQGALLGASLLAAPALGPGAGALLGALAALLADAFGRSLAIRFRERYAPSLEAPLDPALPGA